MAFYLKIWILHSNIDFCPKICFFLSQIWIFVPRGRFLSRNLDFRHNFELNRKNKIIIKWNRIFETKLLKAFSSRLCPLKAKRPFKLNMNFWILLEKVCLLFLSFDFKLHFKALFRKLKNADIEKLVNCTL